MTESLFADDVKSIERIENRITSDLRSILGLGAKVHLTTTDPANHLNYDFAIKSGITVSHIDEAEVLEKYKNEVRSKAAETMTAEDMEYIEEDLRSPCTQEIAVFKAFAEIVDKAENEIVVIDTAPTGHTLLLLDATQSYHKEVERTQGEVTGAVANYYPVYAIHRKRK